MRAFGEGAVAHAAKEREVFGDAAIAIRAVASGRGEGAAVGAHFIGAERVDVSLAGLDQRDRAGVHPVEVVGCEVQVRAPVEAEPADRFENRIDIFLLLLLGIGVVEAHVACAAVVLGEPEVQADRLGVTIVQVTIAGNHWARAESASRPDPAICRCARPRR